MATNGPITVRQEKMGYPSQINNVVPRHGISVLYCADTTLSGLKTFRYLSEHVVDLYIGNDLATGVELFENHQPDLVIVDMDTPGMDGVALCRAIRNRDPGVAIILTSAEEKTEYLRAAIDLSVDKFLPKPVDVEVLMQRIDQLAVDKQQRQSSSAELSLMNADGPKVAYDFEQGQGGIDTRFKSVQRLGLIRRLSLPLHDHKHDAHAVVLSKEYLYILVAAGGGHDLSAEMMTLQIPKIFKSLSESGAGISSIAKVINTILREQFNGHHLACSLIRMNQLTGMVEGLNCGNPPALLMANSGKLLYAFKSTAPALGSVASDEEAFEVNTFSCHEDARMYVFTHGVPEALHANDPSLDSIAFINLFAEAARQENFEQLELLLKQAIAKEQTDDITLLEIPLQLSALSENISFPPLDLPASRGRLVSHLDEHLHDPQKFSVLYIEDDEQVRRQLGQSLGNHVGAIYTATSSEQGMEIFGEHTPSVVIASLDCVKKADFCLVEELRKIDPNVPVILTKGPEILAPVMNLFDSDMFSCLNKSLNMENIFNTVAYYARKRNEQQHIDLSASTYLFSSLAMTITNRDKQIVSVNPAFCRITGFNQEEVIGRTPKVISSGKHDAKFYREMWHSLNTKYEWSGEVWNKRKNGELFLEWININAILDEEGEVTHYFSVFADITERKAAEEAIRKLTYHDALTDIPNRRLFLDRLEQALKKAERSQQRLAVMFVDVDNLKDVNDTLGHDYGDHVIRETAQRLKSCIRDSDTVARFGGDEFTLCLTDLNSVSNADRVAQDILQEMAKPIVLNDEQFHLSVSIGIATYPDDAGSIADLLSHADQAMFSAKYAGRNRVHYFNVSMQKAALARKEMIRDLREAISSQQFAVNYQPIVELATGDIHKAEALIRWHHPERGMVSPAQFIPVAEDTGMITEIGDWVFRQAALQTKAWQNKYSGDFQISINKSPKQFQSELHAHKDWIHFIADIGLSANSVVVEITEGLLMDTSAVNARQLHKFRDAGVQVALDDFGTGYSSLAYLKKFNIDFIKIDQTFVRNLEDSSDDLVMCEAIIVMAHKLGMKVIAEGIETEQQRQLLLAAGCDYGQGYFFSRPVPAEEFESLLKEAR